MRFTAATSVDTGTIPGVVYGVASTSSTSIDVVVPQGAQDGNVFVWDPTANLLSNGFPIDVGIACSPQPVVYCTAKLRDLPLIREPDRPRGP